MDEEFRPVDGYPNYLVGNMGTIKSIARIDRKGARRKTRVLKKNHRKDGYISVRLENTLGQRSILVHRIIATAWIPNTNGHPSVDHKNGIKDDNRISNLQWVTNNENSRKAFAVIGAVPYKGVCEAGGKFVSRIRVAGKTKHLGTFDTAEEAGLVYDCAAERYFGDFSYTKYGDRGSVNGA